MIALKILSQCPMVHIHLKIEGADEAFTEMCYRNAKAIYGDPLPRVVQERLDYELDCIISNGYGVL